MEQLSGSDAIFLALETPTPHAHIGGASVRSPASDALDRVDCAFTVDPERVPDPLYVSDVIPFALEAAAGIDHSVPLRADTEGQEPGPPA